MSHEKLLLHCLGKLALYSQFPKEIRRYRFPEKVGAGISK